MSLYVSWKKRSSSAVCAAGSSAAARAASVCATRRTPQQRRGAADHLSDAAVPHGNYLAGDAVPFHLFAVHHRGRAPSGLPGGVLHTGVLDLASLRARTAAAAAAAAADANEEPHSGVPPGSAAACLWCCVWAVCSERCRLCGRLCRVCRRVRQLRVSAGTAS